jgi:hypothetical protein
LRGVCPPVRTGEVVSSGADDAALDVVVVGCAPVTTSEVVVPFGLADAALDVVVVGRGTLAEALVLVLELGLVLSVGAAPVSWLCSGMTVSCREVEPPV